ncbi:MAG: 4Fe-4S binding protein [Thermodesulfobacteriota bacterium]
MKYGTYRRATQLIVFGFMFLIPALNLFEIYLITGTYYAVSIGGLSIADPAVIVQAVFASGHVTISLVAAGLFSALLALLFGRVWCGWACPYHLVADAVNRIRRRVARREPPAPSWDGVAAFRANVTRFGFLVVGTFTAGVLAIPVLNFVSAPGILSTEAMILVKERTVSVEIGFIALLVVVELLVLPRFWCRLFCPTGSVLAVFRTPFTLHVATSIKTPKAPCCKGNYCSAACPMGLSPFREGSNMLCTNCGRCIDACQAHGGPGGLRFAGFFFQGGA